jgi:hypothetical protein
MDGAALIALGTVSQTATEVAQVRFVLFDGRALSVFRQAADTLGLDLGQPG